MGLGLTAEDVRFLAAQGEDIFLGPRFQAAYQELGAFTDEGDRLKVTGLLMFSIAHCMYDLTAAAARSSNMVWPGAYRESEALRGRCDCLQSPVP
mmetsp:Transcript_4019/g.8532  ORF Transcript_4019/g.8532 Transcript_4019/m.8532 type:complete len:95 (+) Transcript_4019:297-581(+)